MNYFDFKKHKVAPGDYTTPGALRIHEYRFKTTKNTRYFVFAVEYEESFFAVKFHARHHKDSIKKYNLMTNKYEARMVINTVFQIVLKIASENPSSSFIFIGETTEKESKADLENCRSNTKRFRIYRLYAFFFIGDENYLHAEDEDNSVYVLVSKHNPNLNGADLRDISDKFEPIMERALNLCPVEN